MASIRKAKKLGTYVPKTRSASDRQLLKETRELVSQANRRLKGLKQAGYEGTWASRKLINRIDTDILKGWKGGKIKLKENITGGQLRTIKKATEQYLRSLTSKVSGINKTKEKTIQSLKGTLSTEKLIKSDADIETAYNMLSDNDFDYFNTSDRLGASTLWALIDDAIEKNESENTFVNKLMSYMENPNDADAREHARRLYDKYVL